MIQPSRTLNGYVSNAMGAVLELADRLAKPWRIVRFFGDRQDQQPGGFEHEFQRWSKHVINKSLAAQAALEAKGGPYDLERIAQALAEFRERFTQLPDTRQDFAGTVQVFGVTCLKVPRLGRDLLPHMAFDRVIVDEAAKATPTEVLVSLIYGKRFIIVGDHKQLPPYLDSQTEAQLKAEQLDTQRGRKSLFEDLYEKVPEDCRDILSRQYRMHRSIGGLVSDLYYEGRLEHGVSDEERTLHLKHFGGDHRVFWIDVSGQEKAVGSSYFNGAEIDVLDRLLRQFEAELAAQGSGPSYSCGVIAAYAEQQRRLVSTIIPDARRWTRLTDMQVATVDAFQGKQKDIILYSMVRTSEGKKRFISDPRRLNVAFSRARRLLIIVGSKQSAIQSGELARVLDRIPPENILPAAAVLSAGGKP